MRHSHDTEGTGLGSHARGIVVGASLWLLFYSALVAGALFAHSALAPTGGPQAEQARTDAFRLANPMPDSRAYRPERPAISSSDEDRLVAVRHGSVQGR